MGKEFNRSKCTVCGKVRERKYLKKMFGEWVCDRIVGYAPDKVTYVKYKDKDIKLSLHKCEVSKLKTHASEINRKMSMLFTELEEYPKNLDFRSIIHLNSPGDLCSP